MHVDACLYCSGPAGVNPWCPDHGVEAMAVLAEKDNTRLRALIKECPLSETKSAPDLVADNARLRALIKDAEWDMGEHGECSWCNSVTRTHDDGCRAFTPGGVVK